MIQKGGQKDGFLACSSIQAKHPNIDPTVVGEKRKREDEQEMDPEEVGREGKKRVIFS